MEINGSDERGINVVRNLIKSYCYNKTINNFFLNINELKFIILDEADSLTDEAQNSL